MGLWEVGGRSRRYSRRRKEEKEGKGGKMALT